MFNKIMRNMTLLTTLAVCSRHAACENYRRIINSVEDVSNEFPFVVSLETLITQVPGYSIYRWCTGSLILTNWVLTAAHCLTKNLVIVRYGDMSAPRKRMETYGFVIKKVRHPNFKSRITIANDIGLILTRYVEIDIVGRISAVDVKTLTGLAVRTAGFGSTQSLTSRRIDFKIVETDMLKPLHISASVVCPCPKFKDNIMWVPHLCVRPKCSNKRSEVSKGDSGGPLIFDGKIIAVTSGGLHGVYSVLTPVSPYLGWIRLILSS